MATKKKTKKKMQSGGTSGGYPQSVSSTAADKAMATPAKSSTVREKAAIPSASKMKKMQDGGPADAMRIQQGQKVPTTKETMNYVRKNGSGYKSPSEGAKATRPASKGYDAYKKAAIERAGSEEAARGAGYIKQKGGSSNTNTAKYKTGGMVNPNAKLQAAKVAGSKGVKSGVNPKAAASKVAKGRSGGTSAAPKTAIPKAKYGMTIKKKQDGGPSNAADAMIAQQLKSRGVQKGMNQARAAAKKGRAGKI
jgi:hypothetical protein